MRNRQHSAIEQECPPRDRAPGHPSVKDREPRNQTNTAARSEQTGCYEKRVMDLMVATPPWDWPQCRDLSANGQIENSPNFVRRQRMHHPSEHNQADADRDYASYIELGRPRQRAIWGQDAEILDRGFVPDTL